jgi:hypothetical protein
MFFFFLTAKFIKKQVAIEDLTDKQDKNNITISQYCFNVTKNGTQSPNIWSPVSAAVSTQAKLKIHVDPLRKTQATINHKHTHTDNYIVAQVSLFY